MSEFRIRQTNGNRSYFGGLINGIPVFGATHANAATYPTKIDAIYASTQHSIAFTMTEIVEGAAADAKEPTP